VDLSGDLPKGGGYLLGVNPVKNGGKERFALNRGVPLLREG